MLRITPVELNGRSSLKLEGKLSGPWVDETEGCWSKMERPRSAQVGINLHDVSYADDRGKDLLLLMEREGASLIGASEFLRNLLDEHRHGRERSKERPARVKGEADASAIQS